MLSKHRRKIILATLCLFAVIGCKKSDSSSGTFDPPSSDPDVPTPGVIDAAGGFNVKVDPPDGTNYYIHLAGDFDKKCAVDPAETVFANQDLTCIVEVEELEAYINGVDMVLNAPPSMCTYIVHYPYYYFGESWGNGPTAVTASFDNTGTFDALNSSITGATGQFNSKGQVVCDYDHSTAAGPNCCMGTYTLTTNLNYNSVDAQKPPSTTILTGVSWGGAYGNCATGSGSTAPRYADTKLPAPVIYFKPDGFSKSFPTGTPVAHLENSYYIANYYTGAAPAAMGNPYYEWLCLDDAQEIKARIRVQVREWNEISQFALKATGNPDSSGVEPNWGTNVNDYLDWLDVVTNGDNFPGMPTQ